MVRNFWALAISLLLLGCASGSDQPASSAEPSAAQTPAARNAQGTAPASVPSNPAALNAPASPIPDAAALNRTYTLQPGDILLITSFDDDTLKRELPVLPDGKIYYPGAGGVMAVGVTPKDLQDKLGQALIEAKILRDGSQISVTVEKIVGNMIYVTGQVRQPGAFTTSSNVTVMQALSLAGGLTPFASRGGIKILRQDGAQQIIFHFNYNRVSHGKSLDSNIVLHAGDTVIVP